jgi:hypothetical protein
MSPEQVETRSDFVGPGSKCADVIARETSSTAASLSIRLCWRDRRHRSMWWAPLSVPPGVSLLPRPNLNPGVPLELFGSGYPGGKIFNKAAFSAAPAGQQGELGRNVLRGFDAAQADLAVQRMFRITEKVGLRLRGEFFNVLNHPNFANPTSLLTSPLFGYSTQMLANGLGSGGANGGFNPLYQIGGPRSVQFALKLQF